MQLNDIADETIYPLAAASLTRMMRFVLPGLPDRFLRMGRAITMSVTQDLSQGARSADFTARSNAADEARLQLKAALQLQADKLGSTSARGAFYAGCASQCEPPPRNEIPEALQAASMDFNVPQLATEPYSYGSVIPITEPPPAPPSPPTCWPPGCPPPMQTSCLLCPDHHDILDDWCTRNDTWHQSLGAGPRLEAICFGEDCLKDGWREWIMAGGVVNFCTSPPSILTAPSDCYVSQVNGARAATMFADSTDKHMTHCWQFGVGVQAVPSQTVVAMAPNLMSVYPDGVEALAKEEDGFRDPSLGWTATAANPRCFGHLGLPCLPFLSMPAGTVDKKDGGFRVISDAGFPRVPFFNVKLVNGRLEKTETEYVSTKIRHGPSRPSKGTPIRLAGDAPNPRETKPPYQEAPHNSCIIAQGALYCSLPALEFCWDYRKCFHQFVYAPYMLPQMCAIVPTLTADGNVDPHMRPVVKHVMAMGWVCDSGYCQRGMNQVTREVLLRVSAEDDRLRALGELPQAECDWLDARKHLADTDYGRQDTLASVSCYADDPRAVVAGLRRTLFLIDCVYDIVGPDGLNLTLAAASKWSAGIWSTWQGIRSSTMLGFIWLPQQKALRTAAYLRLMATGATLAEYMPIILGFLNHIVKALNQPSYYLTTLWRWYDRNKELPHNSQFTPGWKEVDCLDGLRRMILNCPGTTMLRAVSRRTLPFGAVSEYNNDSDACFDVVTVDGVVLRGDKDPPGMGGLWAAG